MPGSPPRRRFVCRQVGREIIGANRDEPPGGWSPGGGWDQGEKLGPVGDRPGASRGLGAAGRGGRDAVAAPTASSPVAGAGAAARTGGPAAPARRPWAACRPGSAAAAGSPGRGCCDPRPAIGGGAAAEARERGGAGGAYGGPAGP